MVSIDMSQRVNFNRILVVGAPGAGKSCFSKKLAEKLNYPLHRLDDYYWLPGWKRINPEEWLQVLKSLCEGASWVIDGNHAKTFSLRAQHADLVIMLDFFPLTCLWRYVCRSIRRYLKVNDNLPKNILADCEYTPKITVQWHIIRLILFYRIKVKSRILRECAQLGCKMVLLRSSNEGNDFLATCFFNEKGRFCG